MSLDITTNEFVIVALSPVVVYSLLKSTEMRKLTWAAVMVVLATWAMYDAVRIVRS